VRQLLDVVHQTHQLPLPVDLGSASQGEAVERLVVSQVAEHRLHCAHEVTNAVTDIDQLVPIAKQAKEVLAVDKLTAVADAGYCHGQQVKQALDAGITPYIARVNTSANTKQGLFTKADFVYEAHSDSYLCPAGERLSFKFATTELGRDIKYYATSACKGCPLRAKCTRRKREGRRITRWVDEQVLEQMQQRVAANPELMRLRALLCEHPFGTLKLAMN
jgi:hypothetical protein